MCLYAMKKMKVSVSYCTTTAQYCALLKHSGKQTLPLSISQGK